MAAAFRDRFGSSLKSVWGIGCRYLRSPERIIRALVFGSAGELPFTYALASGRSGFFFVFCAFFFFFTQMVSHMYTIISPQNPNNWRKIVAKKYNTNKKTNSKSGTKISQQPRSPNV